MLVGSGCSPCMYVFKLVVIHVTATLQPQGRQLIRLLQGNGDLDFWKPNWKARHLIVGSSSQPDMKT